MMARSTSRLRPVSLERGASVKVQNAVWSGEPSRGEPSGAKVRLVALAAVAGGATTSFYAYDMQGNVTTLTDANGAVVGSYAYDAWGNVVAISGARAGENPYRFSTKEQIGGLYHFGYRFYDAGNGRWLNRDPLEEDGGVNLYMGMGNNPIKYVDPYGLDWVDVTVNFTSGWGDALTFGATKYGRRYVGEWTGVGDANDVVNYCSGAYLGREIVGTIHQAAIGSAGGAKAIAAMAKRANFAERLYTSGRFGVTSAKFGSSGANAQGAWNVPGSLLKAGWGSTGRNGGGQIFRFGILKSAANPNIARFHVYIGETFVNNGFANGVMEVKRSLSRIDETSSAVESLLSGIRSATR